MAQYYKRGGFGIKRIIEYATARGFTDLVVINEVRAAFQAPCHVSANASHWASMQRTCTNQQERARRCQRAGQELP